MTDTPVTQRAGQMLRVPDVLSLLQISRRTLFAYIADGLPVHRLSVRVIRFDQDEVLEWARNRCSDRERGDGSSAA